jgi:hypothetical protein
MSAANENMIGKSKKSKNISNVYVSPYFTSLRKSYQNNKSKKLSQN